MLYQRQHRIAKGSSDLACVDTLYKSAPAPHLRELGIVLFLVLALNTQKPKKNS
jgi:hypothetical protein